MSEKFTSMQQAVTYMHNAYNRGGKYLVDGKPKYTAHAVRMEDEHGLTEIAGRYKFVDGKEAAFAEYDYRKAFQKYSIAAEFMKSENPYCRQAGASLKEELPQALESINNEINKLSVLNPELNGLNYDRRNVTEAYRALIGITSQYNVDDINAYLHNVRVGSKNMDVLNRAEKIKKETGIRFGWQPAAKTMDKIEAQLKERALSKQKQTALQKEFLNKIKAR